MSAHSTNMIQTNTDKVRFIIRPIYHILRPGKRLVPLIAADELPSWLKVVGSWCVDVTNIVTVNKDNPHPRIGEYDIICQYCVDATEHMHRNDERRYDVDQEEEQGIDALRERGYAPTGQNQYAQRVPATFEASVQHLIQPTPVRRSQTRPLLVPQFSSPSLPSMPSPHSQSSGINQQQPQQAVHQAMQVQSLQQPQHQQLQYTQQQRYLPQQPYQQQHLPWWQDNSRARNRDQLHHRLLPAQPHSQIRSPPNMNANVIVSQAEETRRLNATAPAFVPSAAGSFDGSAALVN